MANVPIDDNIIMRGDSRYLLSNTTATEGYFIGTETEWNALTTAEKLSYDGKEVIIVDVPRNLYDEDGYFIGTTATWNSFSASEKSIYDGKAVIII